MLPRWHRLLGLTRQAQPWYRDRLREELQERRLATTALKKLSETADVFYIISRAQHDGHPLRKLPPLTSRHLLVYSYLLPKYTLRWSFYRLAAHLSKCPHPSLVREVVNPAKQHKLLEVARRHDIDPEVFVRVCRQLRRIWPLLP